MQALLAHSDSPYVLARDVQLAAKQGDQQRAIGTLVRLCTANAPNEWPVEAAVQAVVGAGWTEPTEQALAGIVGQADARPNVGVEWVLLLAQRGEWQRCGERLRELPLESEPTQRAMYVYLEALYKGNRGDELSVYLRLHGDWLRTSTFAWGAAGYALTGLRNYARAAEWNADWRTRDDIRAWMLVNVVEGLRNTDHDAEAVEASLKALELASPKGQNLHRLWLAADAMQAGDMHAAKEQLTAAQSDEQLDQDYQFLAACVQAAVDLADAAPSAAGAVFARVRSDLAQARRDYPFWSHEPARRRAWQAAVRRVAALRGTLLAKLWAWWMVWN